MRIGCITTSVIPSKTANSIQAVKVCHALKQIGHEIHLWVPDFQKSNWKEIAEVYGVSNEFEITWVPFLKPFKQYDFSIKSVNSAIRWGSAIIYTWALQAAVFANLVKKLRLWNSMTSRWDSWVQSFLNYLCASKQRS